MEKKGIARLDAFLDSEATDYGITYNYNVVDENLAEVEIMSETWGDRKICVEFEYVPEKDDLRIDMYDDNWETVREFDWTVKFFWMKVAPEMFPRD